MELTEGPSTQRARVYGALAKLFQPPTLPDSGARFEREVAELQRGLSGLGADASLVELASTLLALLREESEPPLEQLYEETFEPSGRIRCSPNETAHAPDTPQESLMRTFQLADISGFYKAFGVEVTPGTERVDHIAVELEFMHLLAVKEAVARTEGRADEALICRDAARSFLREHLNRWCDRLSEQLEEAVELPPLYQAAGMILRRFVQFDAEAIEAAPAPSR